MEVKEIQQLQARRQREHTAITAGYNNGCYQEGYGYWVCPQQYRYWRVHGGLGIEACRRPAKASGCW